MCLETAHLEPVGAEDSPEEGPEVPPLVGVLQHDRLHIILVILGLVVRTVLRGGSHRHREAQN